MAGNAYGFQSSGLNNIHLDAGERLEDLFVRRRGQPFETGWAHQPPWYNSRGKYEDRSNVLENLVILIWLQLTQIDLPVLVKQRNCTELRSKTLASIKQEISESLDMYANELDASHESLILWTVTAFLKQRKISVKKARTLPLKREWSLCKQAEAAYLISTSWVHVSTYHGRETVLGQFNTTSKSWRLR